LATLFGQSEKIIIATPKQGVIFSQLQIKTISKIEDRSYYERVL